MAIVWSYHEAWGLWMVFSVLYFCFRLVKTIYFIFFSLFDRHISRQRISSQYSDRDNLTRLWKSVGLSVFLCNVCLCLFSHSHAQTCTTCVMRYAYFCGPKNKNPFFIFSHSCLLHWAEIWLLLFVMFFSLLFPYYAILLVVAVFVRKEKKKNKKCSHFRVLCCVVSVCSENGRVWTDISTISVSIGRNETTKKAKKQNNIVAVCYFLLNINDVVYSFSTLLLWVQIDG